MLAVGSLQLTSATFADTAVAEVFTRLDSRFVHYQTLYKQPIDGRHSLSLVRATRQPITWFGRNGELPWGHDELLGVFLWIAAIPAAPGSSLVLTDHTPFGARDPTGRYEATVRVERADGSAIVLSETEIDHDTRVRSIKLFYDLGRKQLITRADTPAINVATILRADNLFCAALTTGTGDIRTGVAPARQVCFEGKTLVDRATFVLMPWRLLGRSSGRSDPMPSPDLPRLPHSTFDEFAAARPERVKNGYTRNIVTIDESVGAWQRVGDRIWFGKSFYDGEGSTGVGDLGYFDTVKKTFTFLRLPSFAPWSTSALLVDRDIAWVGLVGRYELSTRSNGLVRVDVRNGQTRRYDIHEVIDRIVRWNDTLYLSTDDGLYALRGDRLTRYRFEPSPSRDLVLVAQVLR